jgi:DNA gyrase subunit B
MAFVARGVTIMLKDEREDREMTFHFEGGIASFVRYLNKNKEVLHEPIYGEKEIDNIDIEFVVQYTDSYAESVYTLRIRSIPSMVYPFDGLTGSSYPQH